MTEPLGLCFGIFSTFKEPAAEEGVKRIVRVVNEAGGKISFIFSNREKGEDKVTDQVLARVESLGIPLVYFSAEKHAPELRRIAKERERNGDASWIKVWRDSYGANVLSRIGRPAVVICFGDMYLWSEEMCEKLPGLNLHPALPDGPKGEWPKVNRQIIREQRKEHGVMIHLITEDLDRGPVVTFCKFSVGNWDLGELRQQGLRREFPLLERTVALLGKGEIKIEKGQVLNWEGEKITGGYDLTEQVEEMVRREVEGQLSARKEVRG